ncbi:DUF2061 domain-containing protein [Aquimarina brevivitae]|uniref:Putative membrane protein n=1 Tax=Aquimarina brevivitae TaxID=323412 RepID=A0A4Q7NYW3_9FLAO|nr:DUF2061 domain-containing protein [Aquimarina brevivitae]RZS92240.1 putative membrane protein [Aquimarina brevivitae]
MIVDQMILDKVGTKKTSYEEDSTSESPIRSIAKAVSWRVIGTLDTLIVSYLFTGELVLASSIASIDFITKMLLYFFHERIWNRIKWGK